LASKDKKSKKEGLFSKLRTKSQQEDVELDELKQKVQSDPDDQRLRFKLAEAYLNRRDPYSALEHFIYAADQTAKRGFFPQAVAIYKRAIDIDPKMADIYFKLANCYQKLGLPAEVKAIYEKLQAIYEADGKIRESLEVAGKLLDMGPENVVKRIKLGQRFLQEKFNSQAEEQFLKAAEFFKKSNKVNELIKLYEGILDHGIESLDVITDLVRLYREQGHSEKAVKRITTLKTDVAQRLSIQQLLAEVAVESDNIDLAVLAYENLGIAFKNAGKQEALEQVARRILELNPNNEFAGSVIKIEKELEPIIVEEIPEDLEPTEEIEVLEPAPAAVLEPMEEPEPLPVIEPEKEEVIVEIEPIEEFPIIEEEAQPTAAPKDIEVFEEKPEEAAFAEAAEKPQVEIEQPIEIIIEEPVAEEKTAAEQAVEFIEEVVPEPELVSTEEARARAGEDIIEEIDMASMTEEEADRNLDEAIKIYLKYGLMDRAIDFLKMSLDKYPDSLPIYNKLRNLYQKVGDKKNELNILRQMISLAESPNRTNEAIAYLEDLLAISPDDFEAGEKFVGLIQETEPQRAVIQLFALAHIARDKNNSEKVSHYLEDIIRIDAGNMDATAELLEIYEHQGKAKDVVRILGMMANYALKDGEIAKAESFIDRILDAEPDNAPYSEKLLDIYEHRNNIDGQIGELNRLFEIYFKAQNWEAAETCLRKLLALDESDIQTREKLKDMKIRLGDIAAAETELFALADLEQMTGDFEAAELRLREILKINPSNFEAAKRLKDLYLEMDRPSDAVRTLIALSDSADPKNAEEMLKEARVLAPNDPAPIEKLIALYRNFDRLDDIFNLTIEMVRLIEKKGEFEKAESMYRQMIQTDPERLDVRIRLKDLLLDSHQPEKAVEELFALFEKASGADRPQDAMEYIREILSLQPQNIEAYHRLKDFYLAAGDLQAAVSQMRAMADIKLNEDRLDEAASLHKDIVALFLDRNMHDAAVQEILGVSRLYQNAGRVSDAVAARREIVKIETEANNAEEAATQLAEISQILFVENMLDDAIAALKEIVKLRLDNKDLEGAIAQLTEISTILLDENRFEDAISTRQEIADLLIEHNRPELAAQEFISLSATCREKGRIGDAITALYKAKDIYMDAGLPDGAKSAFLSISDLHIGASEIDKALEVRQALKAIHLEAGDTYSAIEDLKAIADLCLEWKLPDKATQAHGEIKDLHLAVGNKEAAMEELFEISLIYNAAGRLDEAIAARNEIKKYHLEAGDTDAAIVQLLEIASLYGDKDRVVEAIEPLKEALQLNPLSEEANTWLVNLYLDNGKTQEAVQTLFEYGRNASEARITGIERKALEQAVEVAPDMVEAHLKFKEFLIREADTPQAIVELSTLVELYHRENDHEAAIACLKQIQELDPQNEDAPFRLKNIYVELGKTDQAIEIISGFIERARQTRDWSQVENFAREILTLSPNHRQALIWIAEAAEESGDSIKAVESYIHIAETFKELDPQSSCDMYYKALSLASDRIDLHEKMAELLVALNKAPTACDELVFAAEAYSEIGEVENAQRTLHRAIEIDATRIDAQTKLIDLMIVSGETQTALAELLKLADLYKQQGDVIRVAEAYERAHSLDPANDQVMEAMVQAHVEAGESDKAINRMMDRVAVAETAGDADLLEKLLKQMLEIEPSNEIALVKLADIHEGQNRREEAISDFISLAELYQKRGAVSEAEPVLRRVLVLDPRHQNAHNLLVVLLENAGRVSEAVDEIFAFEEPTLEGEESAPKLKILKSVLAIDPQNEKALELRVAIFTKDGDVKNAAGDMMALADLAEKRNDLPVAEKRLRVILEIAPIRADAYEHLRDILRTADRQEEMLELMLHYGDALRTEDKKKQARKIYHGILEIKEDHREALKRLRDLAVESNDKPKALQYIFKLAELAQSDGKLPEVETLLNQALEIAPGNEQAHTMMIDTLILAGENDGAISAIFTALQTLGSYWDFATKEMRLEQILEMDPLNERALKQLKDLAFAANNKDRIVGFASRLVDIAESKGDFETMESLLKEIRSIDSANLNARHKFANILINQDRISEAAQELFEIADQNRKEKDLDAAVVILKRILDLGESKLRALGELKEILLESGDTEGAISADLGLAAIYQETKDTASVEKVLRDILAIKPDHIEARRNIVKLLIDQKKKDKAAAELASVVELELTAGDVKGAIQDLEQILALDPAARNMRRKYTDLLIEEGRKENAAEQLFTLAEQARDVSDLDLTEDTLREILTLGIPEMDRKAHETLLGLFESEGDLPKEQLELFTLVETDIEAGRHQEAIPKLKRICSIDPYNQQAHLMIKDSYLAIGDSQTAVEELFALVDIYLGERRRRSAEKALKEIFGIDSANLKAKEKLADIFISGMEENEKVATLFDEVNRSTASGDFEVVKEKLNAIVEIDPENVEARSRLNALYYRKPAERFAARKRALAELEATEEEEARARAEDIFEDVHLKMDESATQGLEISWDEDEASELKKAAAEIKAEPEVDITWEEEPAAAPEVEAGEEAALEEAPKPDKRGVEPEVSWGAEPEPEIESKEETAWGGKPEPGEEEAEKPSEVEGPVLEAPEEEIIWTDEEPSTEELASLKSWSETPAQPMDSGEFETGAKPGDMLDEIFGPGESKEPAEKGVPPSQKSIEGIIDSFDDLIAELSLEDETKIPEGKKLDILEEQAPESETKHEEMKDAESHFNMGLAYLELEDLDNATAEFERSIALGDSSHNFAVCVHLGRCYLRKNLPTRAIGYYEMALESESSPKDRKDLLMEIGNLYKRQNNPERALECFEEVDSIDNNYHGVRALIKDLRKNVKIKKGKSKKGDDDDNISFV